MQASARISQEPTSPVAPVTRIRFQRLLKKRIICHAVKILLKDRIRRSLQLLFSCFFHVPVFSVFCMHISFL